MYSKLTLIGNLGKKPELRYTPEGRGVLNFSVACNDNFTNKTTGELVKKTIWFRCVAWGTQAETYNKYLKSGSKVFIEGRLNADDNGNPKIWTGQDGLPRSSFEVTVQNLRLLDKPTEEKDDQSPAVEENGDNEPF
jgi:single-strand DNA-binding protein